MLIEVVDTHGRVQLKQRITGVGSQCRIGRSLSCDIVLDDLYAAAEHTLLTLQEDGRVHVQDLDTRNGTRIDGERIAEIQGEIIEQGELIVGRTHLRVRTLHAAIAPERTFHRELLRRYRTLLATIGVTGCLGFAAFLQWLDAPATLPAFMLAAVLLTLLGLTFWTGLWSLITHLNHGAWHVRMHLAIAANCLALCAWGYWLYRMGEFATQWRWLGWALLPCAIGIALLMMYLHLRKATHMTPQIALLFAGIATLALGGTGWLVNAQTDVRDVNRIVLGPAIFPPALRIAPSMDIADYLTDITPLKRAANRNRQESLVEAPLLDADE
jgi:hypothetical protein